MDVIVLELKQQLRTTGKAMMLFCKVQPILISPIFSSYWFSQDKKTLRRRRKLEKATRQLAKQEELKRLHKAQVRNQPEMGEWAWGLGSWDRDGKALWASVLGTSQLLFSEGPGLWPS